MALLICESVDTEMFGWYDLTGVFSSSSITYDVVYLHNTIMITGVMESPNTMNKLAMK